MQKSDKLDRESRVEKRILVFALFIAGILTWMIVCRIEARAQARSQEHLAEEVLRFHILANSDSEEDQALKMAVKQEAGAYLEEKCPRELSISETKDWIRRHTDHLEALCRECVRRYGFDYPVNAAVTTRWFPDREYGEVFFPAGNYETLQIEIGAAKGHNWWCVLYPRLCFTDAVKAVTPEGTEEELKNVLTEEEYSHITIGTSYKIKSYLWELFFK